MEGNNKRDAFNLHYNLSEKDESYLWQLFIDHGMNGKGEHRTKGNHYFLQAICQYGSVEWETWNKELSETVKYLIKNNYPQLMVQDKTFER